MNQLQTKIEQTDQLPGQMLRLSVRDHAAAAHPLFQRLLQGKLEQSQAGALLRNYDAHASHLRRLLLKAATIMPEEAVGYILENVRNEYGNGRPDQRHQLQLQDLAWAIGISEPQYRAFPISPGVKKFIKDVTPFYYPGAFKFKQASGAKGAAALPFSSRAAVAAGAITATELLALEEFKCLQKAFAGFGQEHHIWFDHVTIESEHLEDSVSLALHFLGQDESLTKDVLLGLEGVLEATVHLYDGLLSCLV